MTGMELDQKLRQILNAATRETALSSSAAIVELGFPAQTAFVLVEKILVAKKEKGLS